MGDDAEIIALCGPVEFCELWPYGAYRCPTLAKSLEEAPDVGPIVWVLAFPKSERDFGKSTKHFRTFDRRPPCRGQFVGCGCH